MEKVYFNAGCALNLYKGDMEGRLLEYIQTVYGAAAPHRICCHYNPKVEAGTLIVNVCAGCDRRFGSLYEGVSTISIWELIDQMADFPFPDYGGMKMSVHDACPIRGKPQVHQAIRSLLGKMRIEVVETECHGTRSVCCGDSFYPAHPLEEVHGNMKSRAASMPCEDVVVYCVSCIKSMTIGGKRPRYMIDLLFQEQTEAQVYDTVAWHETLRAYMEAHSG